MVSPPCWGLVFVFRSLHMCNMRVILFPYSHCQTVKYSLKKIINSSCFHRRQLHCQSSVDGGSRQCCCCCSRTFPEEPRCLLVLPEPHQLPVTGHSQWPGTEMHTLLTPPNVEVKELLFTCGCIECRLYACRTAYGRVRSRSSLCWSPACGRPSNTPAHQKPSVWMRTWTCPARQQTCETSTSEMAYDRVTQ